MDLAVAHCTDYHPHSDRAKVSNYVSRPFILMLLLFLDIPFRFQAEALLTSLREKQESSVLQKFRESVARAFVLRAVLGQGELLSR